MDAVESFANALVGLILSWLATLLVLGFSPAKSAAITAMFFGLSVTRSYALRRLFRWLS